MTAIVTFLMAIVLVYASASAGDSTAWKWQDSIVPGVGFDLDAAQIVRVTSQAATGNPLPRRAFCRRTPRTAR